ncbi:MAG: BMP family ABC transporter substrate-binding protein [Treponema sp.]|nr:BMP family ABC transporter substrate-binding protein [Treponema sp.]
MKKKFLILAILVIAVLALLPGCKPKALRTAVPDTGKFSVLVYITGVTAGSPSYEMMADGATEFAKEHPNVALKVYEAGFNQAEWEEQLTSLVADGSYDVVLSSNPSLPEICADVAKKFPNQKFLLTDAYCEGNPNISTWLFNQYEQSLCLGYLAGLVTVSDMQYANSAKKIGFIAAQEYPLLNKHMLTGFLDGARRVDPGITLDFRVIGNWYDANKAADLASSMFESGVDVFTSIAGGADQGMIRTIQDKGAYAVIYNTDQYDQAPGYILGCGFMEQKKLCMEILNDAMTGKIQYGSARIVGVREGYIDFIDAAGYRDYVPKDIQAKFDAFMDDMRNGRIQYTLPSL